jgi:hypothetical protein
MSDRMLSLPDAADIERGRMTRSIPNDRPCTAALALAAVLAALSGATAERARAAEDIPNLVGTWVGENRTVSHTKGFRDWGTKTVVITEQQDRRFRGHFTYHKGTKNFIGVIYPDDTSFTWVAPDSKGYNHGRILDADRIGACYMEPGEEATAGCADLVRKK